MAVIFTAIGSLYSVTFYETINNCLKNNSLKLWEIRTDPKIFVTFLC